VWRGTDLLLDRPVAIKILNSVLAADESYLERFRGEARIAAALSHPGIAAVYDVGEGALPPDSSRPVPYLVMELVEGPSVAQLLAAGALGTDRAVPLVAAAARALDFAHDRGVVHRDVKPANLMLTARHQVKVTDFGIARREGAVPLTTTGQLVGTPEYLAPEVIKGRPATVQSDVYALGVIAYECLSGRRPFGGDNHLAILTAHVDQAPMPLPTDVPATVAAAVMKAMEKDPARRFETAAAFADTLEQAGGDGIDAEPTVWFAPAQVPSPGSGPATLLGGAGYDRADEFDRTVGYSRAGAPVGFDRASGYDGPDGYDGAGGYDGPDGYGVAGDRQPTRRRRVGLLKVAVGLVLLAVAGLGTAPGRSALTGAFPSLFGHRASATPAASMGAGTAAVGGQTGATMADGAMSAPPTSASTAKVAHVPDVRGRTQSSARAELEEAGLAVRGTVRVDAPDVAQGRVVRTDPPAGSHVSSGSRVSVYVSDGRMTVPDLTGHSVADALDILQNQLRMTVVVQYANSDSPAGTVVGQDVRGPGVAAGTSVTLIVAGPSGAGAAGQGTGAGTGTDTPAPQVTTVTGAHW
jgi:serine/threonine-protein kinase